MFLFSFNVWSWWTDTFSKASHCINSSVVRKRRGASSRPRKETGNPTRGLSHRTGILGRNVDEQLEMLVCTADAPRK